MQKNSFVLIDGNAIIHRAFHALPPLTNKEGNMTNAVYGFFSMLLKIIQEVKPLCIAVCFDRPKPTFRQTLYAGYQAKRPKMDMELPPQIKIVHEVLEKSKVTILEIDGYEADDIIGTIAKKVIQIQKTQNTQKVRGSESQRIRKSDKSEDPGIRRSELSESSEMEVIIVSGDRDLLQLVNQRVKMLAPVTGITKMILYDEKAVEEKFGIKPSQVIDYKALVGDASDNYPGVAGVGPKTASDLINKYETLENLYGNLETIKGQNPNLALKLASGAESAGLAKQLASIVLDAPVSFEIEKCNFSAENMELLGNEFEKLGFKSLVSRLFVEESKIREKGREMQKNKDKKDKQLGLL